MFDDLMKERKAWMKKEEVCNRFQERRDSNRFQEVSNYEYSTP